MCFLSHSFNSKLKKLEIRMYRFTEVIIDLSKKLKSLELPEKYRVGTYFVKRIIENKV